MIKQIEQLNKQLVDTEKYIQELRVVRDNLFLELGKASTHLSKEIKDIILDKTIPLFERVGILKWKSQEMGKEGFAIRLKELHIFGAKFKKDLFKTISSIQTEKANGDKE